MAVREQGEREEWEGKRETQKRVNGESNGKKSWGSRNRDSGRKRSGM